MIIDLLVLGQLFKYGARHQQRFEHEPVGLAAAGGQVLGHFFQAEGDQAGRGGHGGIQRAGLHRLIYLV